MGAKEQQHVELFQQASVGIGPHGGGLANIMFLPESTTSTSTSSTSSRCANNNKKDIRLELLEFVTSPNPNSFFSNYNSIYTTSPWVEYQQVLFVAPSDAQTTYVDMDSFEDALLDIFGGLTDANAVIPILLPPTRNNNNTKQL
jgi:hypothetical protein